jgi:CheY-like chemotaxis protein
MICSIRREYRGRLEMGSFGGNVAKYSNAFHLHDEKLHGALPKKSNFFAADSNESAPVRGIEKLVGSASFGGVGPSSDASNTTPNDNRPQFRVAAFGMPAKFQRLVEIVVRHAKHNPFRFVMSATRGPADFDIAMVDMTVRGGPEVASTLRKLPNPNAVVTIGRRDDNSRPKDDLLLANFTLHLLKALNKVVEEQILKKVQAAMPSIPGWAKSKPRVLIVDDSPSVRRQLALALQHMGIDSEGVGAAQEALDVLANRRYDLVFVDVMMPDIDGYKLTRRIKKEKTLKGIPIIILTSRSSPFDLARGALAGCNSYLVKPVSLQSLRTTVSRHLLKTIEAQQFGSVRLSPT